MPPPRLNPGPSGFRTLAAAEICDLHDMWRMGVLRGVRVTSDWTSYVENHRGPAGLPPVRGYVDQQGIHVYWPSGRIPGPGVEGSTTPATEADVPRWVRENFVRVEPGSRVDPVSLGESGSSALRPLDHRAAELVHRYPEVFPGHRIAPDSGQYAEAWRDHTTRLEEMERVAPGTLGNEPVPPHGFMDHEGRYHLPPHTAPDPAAVDVLARTDIAVNPLGPTQPGGVDPLGPTQPGAQGSAAAAPYLSPIAEPGPTGYRALTMEEALDVRAAFGQAGVRHGVASATAGFDEYRANHAISHPGQPLPMNGYVDRNGVHFHLLPDARVANPDAMPPPLRDAPAYQAWLQAHTTEMPAHQLVELGRRHPDAIVAGVSVASDAAGYQRHYLEDMLSGRISRGEADHLRALKGHNPDAYDARLSQLATEHHVAPEPPPQGYWSERALHLPPASDAPPSAAADHPPQSGSTLTGVAPPLVGNHPPQSGTTLTGVAPPAPPDHPGTSGGGRDGFRPLTLDEARTAGTALDRGSPVTVHAVEVTSAVGDFATYRAAFEHAHPGHAVPMMGYRDANGVHIFWTPGRVPDSDAPAPPLRDGSPASEAAYSEWLNRHTSEIPENHLAHAVARDPHLLPGAERLSDAGEYAFAYRRAEVLSFLHDDNPTMLRRLEKLERSDPERFHAEINARADRLHIGDPPASGFFGQNGRFTFLDPAATVAPVPDGLPAQPPSGADGSARGTSAAPPSTSQHPAAASTAGAAPTAEPAVSSRRGDTLPGIGPETPHASADASVGPHSGGSPDTHAPAPAPASGARALGAGIAAWRAISIADAVRSDPEHTAKIIGGEVAQEALDRVLSRVGVGNFSLVYSLANMIGQDSDHDRETLQHATREALREHAPEIAHRAALQANLDVTGHPLPLWAEVVVRLDEIQGADSRLHGYTYAGSIVRYTSAMPIPTHGVQLEDNGDLIQMNRPYLRLAVPLNDAARHELEEAEYQPDASDSVGDSAPPTTSSDAGVPHPAGQPPEPSRSDEPWIPAPDGAAAPPTADSSGTAGAAKEQFIPDKDHDHAGGQAAEGTAHGAHYVDAITGNPYAPLQQRDQLSDQKQPLQETRDQANADHGHPFSDKHLVNHDEYGRSFTDSQPATSPAEAVSHSESSDPASTAQKHADPHGDASRVGHEFSDKSQDHGDKGHEFSDKSEYQGDKGDEFSDKSQDNGDPEEPDASDGKLTTGDNHKDDQYQALESGAPG